MTCRIYYDRKCDELVKCVKRKYNYYACWYAVKVKYKYSFESSYTVSWEVFCLCDDGKSLIWFNDWYEGQDDIEFLEIISDEDCNSISHEIKQRERR